jgi:hypothetical protein
MDIADVMYKQLKVFRYIKCHTYSTGNAVLLAPETFRYFPIAALAGCPLLAELRHPSSAYERLLWRKLTLGIRFSEAANDPTETLATVSTAQVSGEVYLIRFGKFWPSSKLSPKMSGEP